MVQSRKQKLNDIYLESTWEPLRKKARTKEPEGNKLLMQNGVTRLSHVGYRKRWHARVHQMEKQCKELLCDPESSRLRHYISECRTYKGIGMTVRNCIDLRRVHDVYYKPRLSNGGRGKAELKLVITTLSQFMRWAVAAGRCSRGDVWKEGRVFESVANQELVESFLNFFSERRSPGTVSTKATHLKRICDVGVVVLNEEILINRCKLVSLVLQNVATASKRAHRTDRQQKQKLKHRSSLLSSATLELSKRRAKEALGFVMRSYYRHKVENETDPAAVIHLHVDIWTKNFVGLLLLVSGGQRPQVFSQLQVPSSSEYKRLKYHSQRATHFELRTLKEKRQRDLDLPQLILPASVLPYLIFHIDVVRPAIQNRARVIERGHQQPLLLHTKTGRGLAPPEVTTALQAFMGSRNDFRHRITSMDLRRSHATIMHEMYRRNQIFPDLTEDEFLRKISYQMNTSPEQLKRTYMAEVRPELDRDTAALVAFWERYLMT